MSTDVDNCNHTQMFSVFWQCNNIILMWCSTKTGRRFLSSVNKFYSLWINLTYPVRNSGRKSLPSSSHRWHDNLLIFKKISEQREAALLFVFPWAPWVNSKNNSLMVDLNDKQCEVRGWRCCLRAGVITERHGGEGVSAPKNTSSFHLVI